jgi:hypothetical protein
MTATMPGLNLLLICTLPLLLPVITKAQSKNDCSDLKEGTYFTYPKNTQDHWKSERTGNFQKETNLGTGDTSTWQVKWQNNCRYTMKYIAGGKDLKKEEQDFVHKHVLAFEINSVTPDYYIFSEYIDKVEKTPFLVDTMWRKEKTIVADKRVYMEVQYKDIRKMHFKDTSQYALLYIYRSSKLVCSLVDYLVTANDVAMCSMKTKTAYVFKVTKEGKIHLTGSNGNKKSSVDLDIQFGNKYYLNCDIHWSMDRCIPDLSLTEKGKGEADFAAAQ